MTPMIIARVSEGFKTEIETLVDDIGLWNTKTEFITEAVDEHIKKYWKGERYAKRYNTNRNQKR